MNSKSLPSSENPEAPKGVFTVEMPRSCGVSWGSDISFRWIYVLDMDDRGPAAMSGVIQKGDYLIGAGNVSLIAADFDTVVTVSPVLLHADVTKIHYFDLFIS